MKAEIRIAVAAVLLATAIFAVDLNLPLGVAGGVPYVALVLLGLWSARPRATLILAGAGTVLTALGHLYSAPAGIPWMVATNRGFAYFAIWTVATTVILRKRSENEVRKINAELEQRVRDRTTDLVEVNTNLSKEITERQRAEDTLRESQHRLKEHVTELQAAKRQYEAQGKQLAVLAEDISMARDEAEAANRAKSEFLTLMSHELRTPLNAIIGFSEIIKTEMFGPVGTARYRDYAGDVHESGQHLLALINDILDLSKIEAGKLELDEADIDVAEVIHSCLKLVRERARNGGVRLVTEIPEELPALRFDERKLKQILINLLSNAVKFTPASGTVTVKAWFRADSGYVFQVIDTGIGMALEDIPKALSPFGQVDAKLARKYEGTGLGLPLTKSLVEMSSGSMDLQSEVGTGTTVTVRFPKERAILSPAHGLGAPKPVPIAG